MKKENNCFNNKNYENVLTAIDEFNINPDCRQYAYEKMLFLHKKPINELTKNDMEKICHFLAQWRVQGTKRIDRNILLENIKSLGEEITKFKKDNILEVNIEKCAESMIKSYQSLMDIHGIGNTSASKILHLLAPELIVMWDKYIAKMYNLNMNGYTFVYKFHLLMQNLIKFTLSQCANMENCKLDEAKRIIRNKAQNRPLAKIIDEYNWLVATKRLY